MNTQGLLELFCFYSKLTISDGVWPLDALLCLVCQSRSCWDSRVLQSAWQILPLASHIQWASQQVDPRVWPLQMQTLPAIPLLVCPRENSPALAYTL
eukprot:s59_g71.t1